MSDNSNLHANAPREDAGNGTAGNTRRPLITGKGALVRYAAALIIAAGVVLFCLWAIGYFSDARTAQFAVDGGLVVGTAGDMAMSRDAAYFVISGVASGDAVLSSVQKDAILSFARLRIMADAFFAAGVLVFGFGGIIFVAQEGAFDGVAYSVRQLGALFQLGRQWGSKHESYREYKERVAKRPKNKFAHLMIIGALLLIIAFIFVQLFNRTAAAL
ncbi:MAG: DUF3899 domain-containing protein [Firmicutes bacterium]|nr:DUF3899 domain-containing protein [Bacillota bacterium]